MAAFSAPPQCLAGMEWSGPLFQRSARHLLGFLTPVVAELGRSERRAAATRYMQGLLMPGQRKSIEPMAQRLDVEPQSCQRQSVERPGYLEGGAPADHSASGAD